MIGPAADDRLALTDRIIQMVFPEQGVLAFTSVHLGLTSWCSPCERADRPFQAGAQSVCDRGSTIVGG
jgi:hypothetical protein